MNNLYIVATPIGNLQDITIRAIKTLFSVDYLLAENPQKTSLLLNELRKRHKNLIDIDKNPKIILFDEFTENEKIYQILTLFENNHDIALVSEAGTPLLSDPGYKIVSFAIKKGIKVISIPGVSAINTALTTSGLPTDKFLFIGFLPKNKSKKENLLLNLKQSLFFMSQNKLHPTVIYFESPYRIIESLNIMKKIYGDVKIVIARELTKIHEEVIRENIEKLLDNYSKSTPKGEFTVLFNLDINEK